MAKYYPKKDYLASLVADYKFNETSGTVCLDSKGTYNGTYIGTTNVTDIAQGISNTYRTFNGTNEYITFSNQVIPIGKKSIKFKIKTTTTSFGFIINNSGGATANYGFSFAINDSKGVYVNISKGTPGTYNLLLSSNKTVCDGEWHTVLFTWDGTTSTNSAKIYIDDLINEDVAGTPLVIETTNASYNLFVGKTGNPSPPPYFFNGSLDEIEIYNEAIEFTANKYLIQDKNNNLYTLNESNLVQASLQTLDENNFNSNGFSDISKITKDLLLSKFENLEGIKLLVYTDDLEKKECEMIYNCEPFRPIDNLKKNGYICNILFREV
ncbi:cell adhesion protein [Clostridium botulinum B2 128]|uniref:Cell adhesion protein n=1 Tax=Clostridium combesii TaxID=39481 RepID=A0A2G7HKD4_9CLOT|nr:MULTISPECIES: LamG domain-containing protein [Clostridium]NFI43620.1 LamG domain-containing protein [Clostridium botulinum]KEI76990.1 cell adhesion protein [Clostridium botulinum B2 128]KEI90668.1 cell adhesion protein [Clostridium botulinum B2 433]NFI78333.1 LamG domain-containing protein [Clostridium botulinum]NFI82574.1 LamG domain-containing protein [Clostridium botulinum]